MPAIIKLNHLSCLKVTGDQANALLQGQLTCNLDEISVLQSRLGAHCNPQGRVLSFSRVFYHENSYYLLMPREILPMALEILNKYAIFYKLKPAISDELIFLGFQDQPPPSLFPQLPTSIDEIYHKEGISIVKIRGADHRYLIFGQAILLNKIYGCLSDQFTVLTPHQWKLIDIQHKIPSISPETTGKFLPHELYLQQLGAISFNKGCYTGQEIIARMHYRGKLKNQLYVFNISANITVSSGQDIFDEKGKIAGVIIDACQVNETDYTLLVSTASVEPLYLNSQQQYLLTPDVDQLSSTD